MYCNASKIPDLVALVTVLAATGCTLNAAPAPPPAWSLSAGAGFMRGGPADDLESAMRRAGLNRSAQCLFFCQGEILYPRSKSGAFFTASLLRTIHPRAALGLSYSTSDLGSTAGYRSAFERITIGSRTHTVAPVASARTGPLTLLVGPALHAVRSGTSRLDEPQSTTSSAGVGAIGELAFQVSEAKPVYADIRVRYQWVGRRAIGPFVSESGLPGTTHVEVPRIDANFSHVAIYFALRVER